MNTGLQRIEAWPRQVVILVCICFVTLVGLVDYSTGYETFFFTFYLLPVFVGTWRVSPGFGALMSALSVTAWVSANDVAGAHYSSYFIPVWNAGIMFAIYLIIVFLLTRLKNINAELEGRVRLRTTALTHEIQERMRLQKEVLETSDREQRRIGRELHDGLCQHLTGTALASHLLAQQLAGQSPAEAAKASRLLQLVEEAIEMTRDLSHELDPAEMQTGELAEHLEALAAGTSQRSKVDCRFVCRHPLKHAGTAIVTHLYRIAHAAVNSALKRSQVQHIHIELDLQAEELVMTITDDGTFLADQTAGDTSKRLRALAYRADLIGASVNLEPLPRGTRLTCRLPSEKITHDPENQNSAGG